MRGLLSNLRPTDMEHGSSPDLFAQILNTQLGSMLAIADAETLLLLEFVDRPGLERQMARLKERMRSAIRQATCAPIESVEEELDRFFRGKQLFFDTPYRMLGTPFQERVWKELGRIPPGQTRTYAQVAKGIGCHLAFRAVGRANGANQLAIVVPCHRLVQSCGKLAGYGGGLARKAWLLRHESSGF